MQEKFEFYTTRQNMHSFCMHFKMTDAEITNRTRIACFNISHCRLDLKDVQFRQCFDAAERSQVKFPTSVSHTVIGKIMSGGTCFAVQ